MKLSSTAPTTSFPLEPLLPEQKEREFSETQQVGGRHLSEILTEIHVPLLTLRDKGITATAQPLAQASATSLMF